MCGFCNLWALLAKINCILFFCRVRIHRVVAARVSDSRVRSARQIEKVRTNVGSWEPLWVIHSSCDWRLRRSCRRITRGAHSGIQASVVLVVRAFAATRSHGFEPRHKWFQSAVGKSPQAREPDSWPGCHIDTRGTTSRPCVRSKGALTSFNSAQSSHWLASAGLQRF